MRSIHLHYPKLPPSDNKIRIIKHSMRPKRGGGFKRIQVIGYSDEAEQYKRLMAQELVSENMAKIMRFSAGHKPGMIYSIGLTFWFPPEKLLVAGWLQKWKRGAKAGQRKAKNPYKILDSPNRKKLVTDAVAEAVGIDDSLFWGDDGAKVVVANEDQVGVTIFLEEEDPRTYGIPEGYWPE